MFSVIAIKTIRHLELTLIGLFIASFMAIPTGVILSRLQSKRLASTIMRTITMMQAIPGLALLALVIVALALIRPIIVLPTIGLLPSTVILVVYAFIPICHGTFVGITQVSPNLLEVANGMGMGNKHKLFWVEFPLALPVIMASVRMALVWTIGLVTLTSLIGSGGLGDLILQGLRTMQLKLVLAGTLPAALLAMAADWVLSRIEKWLV